MEYDAERILVFRTAQRDDGAQGWRAAPRLRIALAHGEQAPLVGLGWRTLDGAEAAIGFERDMQGFHGYRRATDGMPAEYRGVLERCEEFRDDAAHRFRTQRSRGAEWRDGPDLRLLLEDGDACAERLDWCDRAGEAGALSLRVALSEPHAASEVTRGVGTIRAHHEFRAAGEVADNLLDGLPNKWLGDWADGAWLEFDLVRPAAIRYYLLTTANDCPDRDPTDWALKGSHDGWQWNRLDLRGGQVFTRRHEERGFTVAEGDGTAYRHYRIDFTANAGADHVQLRRVRLFETPPLTTYQGFFGCLRQADGIPSGLRGSPIPRASRPTAAGIRTAELQRPLPRTVSDWHGYLSEYSADIIRVAAGDELSGVGKRRGAGWLGYEGASEERLAGAEARLGTRLPPSYRSFLGASDGFLHLGPFMREMRATRTVTWLRGSAPEFSHSMDGKDSRVLERALLISAEGDAQHWLLDPGDVSQDGEWAAYIWASWYPGLGERYSSFAELVAAERARFERQAGYEGRGVRPEGANELVAQGRDQVRRGLPEQALASFERAAVKGSGAGLYLKTLLGAFLDLRSAHHDIRDDVLGRKHVVETIGADQLRAEAVPLYLRRVVENQGPMVALPQLAVLEGLVPELALMAGESAAEWIARAAAHVPPALPETPVFQQALDQARVLAGRGAGDAAWAVIEAALPHWHSFNPHRVVPVILLTDPLLRNVVTPRRARLAVTLPRATGRTA
ncbi:SMI1/KNR4 family protein [Streptomyces sp. PTM05]|uniref:SMI1/KNR4 family protein n=1 Tax=Streptantibioticus parmotrematis TaxID=2873249 RepID=A0ABS7R1Z1_9ACTN|nr:SMI1/KNR4 family protein [Streptantibioticus parmotrematis]